MDKTPEQIAAGLTKAQRAALLTCDPWDVQVGAGPAIHFICNDMLEDSDILDDAIQLSATGRAVRAILQAQENTNAD